ncbi:M48 family metallopeptidase [Paenibacillus filicis]|uniref:M48 family metallopeptidase n=1 Tax=Paenibacillus filicis TaxID=669464 RepID=A0ABU9DN09_9BACL
MKAAVSRGMWLTLGLIGYTAAIGLYLIIAAKHPIPQADIGSAADPATFLEPERYRQSIAYAAWSNWLFFISYPWEWGIYVWLLVSGTGARLQARWDGDGRFSRLRLPLMVLLLQAAVSLGLLPLRITGFLLSRANGISTQSWGSWVYDRAIDFGLEYLVMVVAAAAAFWMIRRGGRWWLKLWLVSVPCLLLAVYVQPVVIDPLYNTFSRLSDPQLESRILELASRAGISADRVYEVRMSDQTNAMNAYVSGLGSSLRIVLWDTTMNKLSQPEILLIMAHEMGHYVMHHLEWSTAAAAASTLVLLVAGSWIARLLLRRYGESWRIGRLHEPAALPLALLVLSVLSFVTLPLSNAVSRQAELVADRYAFRLIGDADSAVTMYQQLAASSLSEMNPPMLVKLFRSTHPSLLERIRNAQQFDGSHA